MPDSPPVEPAILLELHRLILSALTLADSHRLFDVGIGLDQAQQNLEIVLRRRGLGEHVTPVTVPFEPTDRDPAN